MKPPLLQPAPAQHTAVQRILKLTRAEYAALYGISRQAYHKWLNGGAMTAAHVRKFNHLRDKALDRAAERQA